MGRRALFLSWLFCAILSAAAYGGDEEVWRDSPGARFAGPRDQLSLEVGLRTDASPDVDAQPEVSVKYLRWLSRFTAVTADLGFTNETAFSYRSTARTIALSAGLRFQEPGKIVSVFFEPGLSLQRHSGDLSGTDFTEARLGISLSLGASVSVHKSSLIDISLRQVLNEAGSRPVYATTPALPSPPIDESWDWLGGADTYNLYNTTHFVVSYRFGL